MTEICPICGSEAKVKTELNLTIVDCVRCGGFDVHLSYIKDLNEYQKIALSHWIRKLVMKEINPNIAKYFPDKNQLLDLKLPNPAEQADNLIVYLGKNLSLNSEILNLNKSFKLKLCAVIGCYNISDLYFIFQHLILSKMIYAYGYSFDHNCVDEDYDQKCGMAFKGWQKFEELKKVRKDSKQVFLAMGYGIPETEDLFENHLRKLIEDKLGLKLNILRENLKNGIVDNLMRSEITKSCLLLAEMTHHNRGAYWEAGFAEGLKIPVIYLAKNDVLDSADKDIKPHFDVNHCTFVPWTEETIESDMQELEATIRMSIPDKVK